MPAPPGRHMPSRNRDPGRRPAPHHRPPTAPPASWRCRASATSKAARWLVLPPRRGRRVATRRSRTRAGVRAPTATSRRVRACRRRSGTRHGVRRRAAPDGATAWLPRPIDPMHVLRELDALVARRRPRRGRLPQTPVDAGRRDRACSRREPAGARAAPAAGATCWWSTTARSPRFLEMRLQRLGYRDLARSAASWRCWRSAPTLVFLDVELGGAGKLDGLAVCQHIAPAPPGRRPSPRW